MTKLTALIGIPAFYLLIGPPVGGTILMAWFTLQTLIQSPELNFNLARYFQDWGSVLVASYFFGGLSAILSGAYLGWRVSSHQPVSLFVYYSVALIPPSVVFLNLVFIEGASRYSINDVTFILQIALIALMTDAVLLQLFKKILAASDFVIQTRLVR